MIIQNNEGVMPFYDKKSYESFSVPISTFIYKVDLFNTGENKITYEGVDIKEVNWNPFIYISNKKYYYQRDFCWSLENKQNLIESIYLGVDCGKIVLHVHDIDDIYEMIKNGEKEVAFYNIVDGKQRLNALQGFINNQYADKHGNYYRDFSLLAKRKFTNSVNFQLVEMKDCASAKITTKDILEQFLLINHAGVPQSNEHINYIKEILVANR